VVVTTSEAIATQLAGNDTATAMPAMTEREMRLRRIQEISESIERGVYSVSACQLADAILRAARRAN
jgi:anti-sigma28 factor (negative regulator of flagellin synthesis)